MLRLRDALAKYRDMITISVKRSDISSKLRQQCDHNVPDRDCQTSLINIDLSTKNSMIRYIAKQVNAPFAKVSEIY